MSEIPQPIGPVPPYTPTGALHPDDLDASLRGLQPGLYLAADLYRHYADVATEAGRQPATRNTYGKALRATGYRSRHDSTGNHRCWIIE